MILLDTHVWVRWLSSDQPLPAWAIAKIADADEVGISAVSCWEVAYLAKRGRLDLRRDVTSWISAALEGSGVTCLGVDRTIAILAASLPDRHRDPADRLIIATAVERNCDLISFDDEFRRYEQISSRLLVGV